MDVQRYGTKHTTWSKDDEEQLDAMVVDELSRLLLTKWSLSFAIALLAFATVYAGTFIARRSRR